MTRKKLNNVLALVLAAVLSVGLLPIQASATTADFADVAGHWAIEDIRWARSHNVVDGVGNNRFEPERTVTNAEMIKMLVGAFLADEYATYEAAHLTDLERVFAGGKEWYSYKAYFMLTTDKMLSGLGLTVNSSPNMNSAMNRANMAQILSNVMRHKSLTATTAQKDAAKASMTDYASIPSANQDAVLTCYALGIINGDGNQFKPSDNMTRAQACAVIHRMSGLLGGTVVDPDPGTSTEPETPTVKDIEVTSMYWSGTNTAGAISGNAWMVTDNNFGDGYLNNGRPITEENVIELLHEAEKIWPTGTKWSETGSNNNFYKDSGTVSSTMLKPAATGTSLGTSSNFGCGGYAAMISDYLFGRDNNMFHRVASVNDIRPGDIIVEVTNNRVVHVMVAVTASGGAYGETAVTRNGYVHITDGNDGDQVSWPNKYAAPLNEATDSTTTWQIYSRYPASTATQPATPTTTPDPTPSTPDEPTVKDVQTSSEYWSGSSNTGAISGNAWTVTDNGFGDGYLNNGKPITEENVIELLHEAEKIWPAGIKWSEAGSGNNFYKSSGTVSAAMLKTQTTGMSINISSNFGCGGYAAMISDYLFGRDNNMFHRVASVNDIHPGDIIVEVTNNTPIHVMVAVTASGGSYTGLNGTTAVTRNGYVHVADGNTSDKVSWPNKYSAPLNEDSDSTTTWQVYSRYPA